MKTERNAVVHLAKLRSFGYPLRFVVTKRDQRWLELGSGRSSFPVRCRCIFALGAGHSAASLGFTVTTKCLHSLWILQSDGFPGNLLTIIYSFNQQSRL